MIISRFPARKSLAAVLSAALLVSAPGPLAVSAAAQVMNLPRSAGMTAGVGAASVGTNQNSGASIAPLAPAALTLLSAPSIIVGAPSLSAAGTPSAAAPAAAPALRPTAAASVSLPAAAPAPGLVPAAAPAPAPLSAPALVGAPNAAASIPLSAPALASERALAGRLDDAAKPGADGAQTATTLNAFYNGLAAAAPCIFAKLAGGSTRPSGLQPSDAPAGTPVGAPSPSLPEAARFQVGPVHLAAMKVMAGIWSVWDRAIDSKWDKMPPMLGVIYLYFNEQSLRLHVWDANALPTTDKSLTAYAPANAEQMKSRSPDGSYFDNLVPAMAKAGSTRWNQLNTPDGPPNPNFDKMEPNPLSVSQALDKREIGADGRPITKEAGILNDWAAAEIQAQVHDWGNHVRQPITDNPVRIKIPAGHPLGAADHETEMVLDRTEKDPTLPADYTGPTVHRNAETPGWDMSNIYGSSLARQLQVRTLHDGKLKIGADGRLLDDPEKPGLPLTGFNDNIHPLLTMYHTIWTLEHNSVADAVKSEHPDWNDQQIFDMARLRVTALNARIHTVEWTRALLPHPTLHSGMWADWYGTLGKPTKLWIMRFSDRNPRLGKILGFFLRNELVFGIPGTKTQHYGKNYSFVEEFFDVYRLHTMIRDWNKIQHLDSTGPENEVRFLEDLYLVDSVGFKTVPTLARFAPEDMALSYGLESAGALTLNNVPDVLRNLTTQDGRHIDLSAVDIIRTRERLQSSRYNQFVRRLGERAPKTFLELTGGDVDAAAQLASQYKTVEEVDFQPGIRAERKPALFALGNRQFKPFVLSAPARLKNDRLLSEQYNSATYGESGMEYIEHTNFSHLLLRHYPSLRPAVEGLDNAFRPWDKPGSLGNRLSDKATASSASAASAAFRNLAIGGVIALGAAAFGVATVGAVLSLTVIPLATAIAASKLIGAGSDRMANVLVASKTGETTSQLAPLFAAEKTGRLGALINKLGAFTVMDVGGMIAFHLFAAHPVGALILGAAAVYSGMSALKAARVATADQTNVRVNLAAKLTADLPHTDPKDIRGNRAIEKRYWVMRDAAGDTAPLRAAIAKVKAYAVLGVAGTTSLLLFASHPFLAVMIGAAAARSVVSSLTAAPSKDDPSILHYSDTYSTLRRSGLPVLKSFMTATMWHLPFARKTWTTAPEAKAALKPGFFDVWVPGLINTQAPSNNRVFSDGSNGVPRGDIDMKEFDRLFRDFGMHDYLTAYDLARIREANQYRDAQEGKGNWFSRLIGRYASKRRADQLIELFSDRVVWEDGIDGGWVPAISRDQLLRFYQGGLQYDIIRDRTTPAAASDAPPAAWPRK